MQAPASLTRAAATVTHRLGRVPLRLRLVLIVLTLLGVALLTATGATAYLMERDLQQRIDTELDAVAASVAKDVFRQDQQSTGGPTGYAFVLYGPDGSVALPFWPTGQSARPTLPALQLDDPRVTNGEHFTLPSTSGEGTWRFVARVVHVQVVAVGQSEVIAVPALVGVSLDSVDHTVERLTGFLLLVSALLLLASAGLGWYAVRRAFRPLREIEDTAAAIAAGDLTRRIEVRDVDDEVASLSRSLNTMLTDIEVSFAVREASEDRMRQFVADASHELRTPLATIRGYAELFRQGALRSEDDVAAAVGRIEAESGRMSGLVEDLLTLARLDQSPASSVGLVDLTVLAGDAVADARVRAADRRITLVGYGGVPLAPAQAWGAEERLRQVVTNLVANALRHTPDGTPVEVVVGTDGNEAVLEVRDHGPGIPEGAATKVFERFYRADPSRGRSGGGGNGLGLAIVAAIAAAHQGRVGVAQTAGGGATFVVRLPTSAPQTTTGHSQEQPSLR